MNQTALVTGAASGIGAALARRLLMEGFRVGAADLNTAALDALGAEFAGRVLSLRLDVRKPEEWEAAWQTTEAAFGPVEVLFNVAGVLRAGYAHEITPADVDFNLDINTKGLIHGTCLAARRMRARKQGHIINIASTAGLAPVPGMSLYSASKFAVRAFTLSVAQELRADGVRVTVICPDAVKTPMLDQQVGLKQTALTFSGDRYLTPDDVVAACMRALDKAPLEIMLPLSRGILAKLASLLPGLNRFLMDRLLRRGMARQAEYKV